MPLSLIVLAIPVFFLLIAVELVWTRIQERDYYRLSDSLNDLSCGILQQLIEAFLKTALFAGYVFLFEHYRLFTAPYAPWAWVACFVGVDFFYYWFHRTSHEVNAVWATHVVHHQSEEFNLTVALRQGAFQGAFSWVFYLPLAILGFPPLMFLTLTSINTLYQFWIHTRAIGNLGPLEWVLNTPSNHRVHHGRNPKYIDRNHGGTLIVWDRLFGTYQAEEEEVAYGITTPLSSWNPVWANLHYWVELWQKAKRAARPLDKLRMFLKPPGWLPADLGGFQPAPDVAGQPLRRYETPVPAGLAAYILAQFGLVLLGSSVLLFAQNRLPGVFLGAAAVMVALSLVALGGLFERKRWALWMEAARLVLLTAAAAWWLAGWTWGWALLAAASLAAGAVFLVWLRRYRPFFAVAGRVAAGLMLLSLVSCEGNLPETADYRVAVGSETFTMRLTDPPTIALAEDALRGRVIRFPSGPLRRGDGGFNAPWSWHLDPAETRMVEVAIEVCDGTPSYVDEHVEDFVAVGYCPWSARLVARR